MLRNSLLLNTQVIPDKGTHIIFRTYLDLIPVFFVVVLLLLRRQAHQNEVPDLVTFAEVKTGRVQTFKNELWIVVHLQPDVDNLQTANRIVKLINGNFLLLNSVIEIIVVHGQIGLANMLRRIREQFSESSLVIFDRLELDTGILRLPFVHEVFLENPLLEISGLRHDDFLINQVIHSKEQQQYRREALLVIDNQELLIMAVRIVNGNEAPEEVTLPVSLDDFYKVIVQLLAVLCLPVIIPLVHRDDEALVGALHVFNKFTF